MDAHAGAAKGQCPLEGAFGDLGAQGEADPVVHGGGLGVGGEVGDRPSPLLQVGLDGLFEGVPGEVGSDDDVLIACSQHCFVLS